MGNIARALVSASACNDRAEVKWWNIDKDPKASLEDLASSGGERFENLDDMLADGLKSKLDNRGHLRRVFSPE